MYVQWLHPVPPTARGPSNVWDKNSPVVTYCTQLHYKLMLHVSTLSGSMALNRLAIVTVAPSLSTGAATCRVIAVFTPVSGSTGSAICGIPAVFTDVSGSVDSVRIGVATIDDRHRPAICHQPWTLRAWGIRWWCERSFACWRVCTALPSRRVLGSSRGTSWW